MNQISTKESINQEFLQANLIKEKDSKIKKIRRKRTSILKLKPLKRRSYNRTSNRILIHNICIVNKADLKSGPHTIKNFVINEIKTFKNMSKSIIGELVQKKNDQILNQMFPSMNSNQIKVLPQQQSLGLTNNQNYWINAQTPSFQGQCYQNQIYQDYITNLNQALRFQHYNNYFNLGNQMR